MRLGMIGLGRMGTNMVRRLIKKHDCVVYDLHAEAIKTLQERYSNENKSPGGQAGPVCDAGQCAPTRNGLLHRCSGPLDTWTKGCIRHLGASRFRFRT